MNTGIGPTGCSCNHSIPNETAQNRLELSLAGPYRRLKLPPRQVLTTVLDYGVRCNTTHEGQVKACFDMSASRSISLLGRNQSVCSVLSDYTHYDTLNQDVILVSPDRS